MSDSLWPHELQHARLPCPSPSPGACSNSCLLSQWCHSPISSSVAHFLLLPSVLSASGSFPVSQLFASGGQSIGASASAPVLPMYIQDWCSSGLTGLISLLSIPLNWTHLCKLAPSSRINPARALQMPPWCTFSCFDWQILYHWATGEVFQLQPFPTGRPYLTSHTLTS